MTAETPEHAAFIEQVATIRAQRVLGRSEILNRLFDYLVETSGEGRSPKEVELGEIVLARGSDFDTMLDSSVRVYVHRLRRKLDDYYAGAGADQPWRLALEKGEYRLSAIPIITNNDAVPLPGKVRNRRQTILILIVVGVALALASSMMGAWWASRGSDKERELRAVRHAPLWAPIIKSPQPIVIVLGDYYIFGERENTGEVNRLVREFSINSRNDLEEHIMVNPNLNGKYVDLGLRYYPLGVASALRDVLSVIMTDERMREDVRVIPASELTAEMLGVRNIIYIGYMSGLGPLRDPLFNGSRYTVGNSYDELIDKRTGKSLLATTSVTSPGPQQDFGYISRFPGPNNNNVVIIAGARDAGVMQAAEYSSRRATAETLTADADAFEALLTVPAFRNTNLVGRLIAQFPLDRDRIWRPGAPQSFPDDEHNPR